MNIPEFSNLDLIYLDDPDVQPAHESHEEKYLIAEASKRIEARTAIKVPRERIYYLPLDTLVTTETIQ